VGLAGTLVALHAVFFAAAGPADVAFPSVSAPPGERWAQHLRAVYRFRIWAHTAGGLREREAVIDTYVEAVRRAFDPADTALVTELGNRRSYPWFRHVMYYLPEFPVYLLRVGSFSRGYLTSQLTQTMAALDEPDIVLSANVRRLVWVVDAWNPELARPPGLEARPLPHGRWLYVLRLEGRTIEHAGYRLAPVTAVARLR
jgi:hypothetical protein